MSSPRKGPGKRGHIVPDTLLPTQMFPRLPARATFVADTNFVSGIQKCFWFCSEAFCVRNKCFPVCAAQETWWATMCPQQRVLVYQGLNSTFSSFSQPRRCEVTHPEACGRYVIESPAQTWKRRVLFLRIGQPSTLAHRELLRTAVLRFSVDRKQCENEASRKRWRHDKHVIEFSARVFLKHKSKWPVMHFKILLRRSVDGKYFMHILSEEAVFYFSGVASALCDDHVLLCTKKMNNCQTFSTWAG